MKIVKPLRLGLLHRPFRWQQRDYVAFTVLAHVSLTEQPVLLHDNLAWGLHGEEPHVDALFDQFMPKPVPEFLVSGFAHTAHNPPQGPGAPARMDVAAVSARLADKEKRLTVHGDRYWVDGRPTPPLPFERMPIGRGLAFGGPEYPENPGGRGHATEMVNGVQVQRLPNIETDAEPIHSPRQVPARHAGLGMLDLAAPSQMARLGDIDAHYLERDHPGLPSQADWQYFNVAPPDQRWTALDRLPPGLPYVLRHLHPDHAVQEGRLPDAHARCFIARKAKDGGEREIFIEEVGLRLTTVWFFPHRESAVLLYHGSALAADHRGSDITHAMPAYESTGMERPLAHFEGILRARTADRTGMLHTFREADLISESLIGEDFDTEEFDDDADSPAGPMVENMRRRKEALMAQRDEHVREAGRSPEEFTAAEGMDDFPRLRRLADLPEFQARMDRKGAELDAMMAKQREQMLEELRSQPPTAQTEQLIGQLTGKTPTAFDLAAMSEEIRGMWKARPASVAGSMTAEKMEDTLKRAYVSAATYCAPAKPMDAFRAAVARTAVMEKYALDRDLSNMNLSGADLSGLDLRGANLRGSLLDGVDFTGTLLDGADLSESLMVRTRLVEVSMRGCRCDNANFSKSSARKACFAGLLVSDVTWEELDWEDCDLSEATLTRAMLNQSVLHRCDFTHARLEEVAFYECTGQALRFAHANLLDATWLSCLIPGCVFDHAVLDACGALQTDLSAASFRGARMKESIALHQTTLDDAVFDGATIESCNFRGTPIARGQFNRAVMHESDFSDCMMEGAGLSKATARECMFDTTNLRAAVLRDANLIGSNLQAADLRACDLSNAVLFGAELSRIITDASTVFDGVLAERANVYPRAVEAA